MMLSDLPALLPEHIVDQVDVGIVVLDSNTNIVLWNRFMAVHSARQASDVLGRNLFDCFPELPRSWLETKLANVRLLKNYAFTSWEHRPYLFAFPDYRAITGTLGYMHQSCTFLPIKGLDDAVTYICLTIKDYTETASLHLQRKQIIVELEDKREEQRRLIGRLEEAHNQLLQSEKLASIGQLAAGVAHEINNPIGFVNSNLGTLEKYLKGLVQLVNAYEAAESVLTAHPKLMSAVSALKDEIDLEFLKEDVVGLIAESKDGLDRVKKIVDDLKDFSRLGESKMDLTNLHACMDSTLNVVSNEVKYKAEIVKAYGNIPEVECVASQINQVFMNLLINAAHAIPDRGRITIATSVKDEWVCISVSDTGAGIAPEHLSRIFDPFFTTKPVGQGTGLGLSVSYSIIAKHGGRIEAESRLGFGTAFHVWLPVKHTAHLDAEALPAPHGA